MHEPDAASRVAPAHVPPATAFGETATLVLLPVVFFLGIVTIARLDHRIEGSPKSLRLLILPGVAALWLLFAWRWMAGVSEPAERNPHRTKAGAR